VVTHGTDTMEETVYALAAMLDVDVPDVAGVGRRRSPRPRPARPASSSRGGCG
jgi:L-asparaginase/Glu-tRNA(Gln) amidotransferase subunit D